MQTSEYSHSFSGKYDFADDNLDVSQTIINQQLSTVQLISQINSYKPKSDLLNLRQLALSENTKLKKYKIAVYYGEFVNGKRHGLGVMIYNNKKIYQGQWQSDFKHGHGFQLFPNGCTYKGFYVNGKPQGVGRFQWPNGEFYQGEWLSGMKHGSGLWNGAKGDSYVGEWKFGKADGFGVHLWINGDRYEGQFKQSLKHGEGTQKFVSGDLYKGQFFEGKPQGYGQYFWKDGSFYKGEFRKGFREGSGVWRRAEWNGDKYEGEYVRDKKQGYGIYNWNTGNVYKGHYFEDLRDGFGEMFWTDGSYYKGEWRKGNQEGEGTLFTPEKGLCKGLFKNNELVQVYSELQPLNNAPVFKKRNKRAQSNLAGKIVNSTNQNEKGVHDPSVIRYRSSTNRTRQSLSKSVNSKIKIFQMNASKKANPQTLRQIQEKIHSTRYLNKIEMASRELSPVRQEKKEQLGHSSVLLKYLERRMKSSSGHYGQIRAIRRSNINDINTRLKNMELDNE